LTENSLSPYGDDRKNRNEDFPESVSIGGWDVDFRGMARIFREIFVAVGGRSGCEKYSSYASKSSKPMKA
jgi:hypothetical protein